MTSLDKQGDHYISEIHRNEFTSSYEYRLNNYFNE